MKKLNFLFLTLCMSLLAWQSNAQAPIGVPDETENTFLFPISSSNNYSYSQQIIYANEINATGNITSISFYYEEGPTGNSNNWDIYLQHTNKTKFDARNDWISAQESDKVFSGTVAFPAEGNWVEVVFDTPFVYNGSQNLVVSVNEKKSNRDYTVYFGITAPYSNDRSIIAQRNQIQDPSSQSASGISHKYINTMILGGIQQACKSPTGLAISDIQSDSATVAWSENGTSTNWEVFYGPKGFDPLTEGTSVLVTANPTVSLTGLISSTAYDVYIQSNCGGAAGMSAVMGPKSFNTPGTVPFAESFETGYANNQELAGSWSQEIVGWGIDQWRVVVYSDFAKTGTNFISLPAMMDDKTVWIFYPLELTGGVAYNLKLHAKQEAMGGGNNASIEAAYGAANNAAAMTNAIVASTSLVGNEYNEISGVFTPANSGVYYIGIKGATTRDVMGGLYLDDISVEEVTNWLGTTAAWANASNWSHGLPTLGLKGVIDVVTTNYPIISTTGNVVNGLEVKTGASLQIAATGSLTIKGDVTQNGSFTILSDATNNGSLIVEGSHLGSNTIEYQRYVTSTTPGTDPKGWHLISSPVIGQKINAFTGDVLTNGNKYAIAPYDNSVSTDRYNYYTTNAGSNDIGVLDFEIGKGYSVKRITAGTFNFSGILNTDDVQVAITDNTSISGNDWNLIGNPYTSSISLNNDADAVNNFLKENATKLNATNVAIYQWNAATTSYDIINQATGSAKYVAPGQGFFVRALAGGETINFTELMQAHQTGSLFSKSENTTSEINLFISDGTKVSKTQIKYIDDTTTGLDVGYDAGVFSGVSNNLNIFTHLISESKGVDFALQCLPNQELERMVIPVGLKMEANTNATISAETLHLPEGITVYLEDKETNTFTNLSTGDYSFKSTEKQNGIGRFYLHTSAKALSVDTNIYSENISMYKTYNLNIRIVGVPSGTVNFNLYDVLGKAVFNTKFAANNVNDVALPSLNPGMYFIRLETKYGIKTTKIIIE